MPGIKKCVRCGGVLGLVMSDINVQPPRASQRRLRMFDGFGRLWNRLTGWTRQRIGEFRADIDVAVPLITLIWPGWPQFCAGRVWLGRIFSLLFVLSLIPALLTWGSWLSTLLLGIALAAHFSSVMDIVLHTEEGRQNVGQMFTLLGIVVGVIYLPAYLFGQTIVQPVVIERSLGTHLPVGDVLLINRRLVSQMIAQPGDVVLYDMSDIAVPGYVIRGKWMERVLARGPCRVEYSMQQLKVDGQPVPYRPLGGQIPEGLDMWIADGNVLIVPPIFFMRANQGVPVQQLIQLGSLFDRMAVVPNQRIRGRAVWRTWPLNRWGAIE